MPRALDLFPRCAILALYKYWRSPEWRENFLHRFRWCFLMEDVWLGQWAWGQVGRLGEDGRDATVKDGVIKHSWFLYFMTLVMGESSLLRWFFTWDLSNDFFCQVNWSWRMTLVMFLYLALIHCIKVIFILLTSIPRMSLLSSHQLLLIFLNHHFIQITILISNHPCHIKWSCRIIIVKIAFTLNRASFLKMIIFDLSWWYLVIIGFLAKLHWV